MTHGSLFSGIGGFDLAAEWMGWGNMFHCEWNSFCQKVLKKHFPNSIGYGNIIETDFVIWEGLIDVLSGGFPCQPYSQAGKRKGKEDDRHLWPEMLRAIREIQPRWIVGENVPGIINWSRGMVVNEIKTNLEDEGFAFLPPLIIPACAKDAPHRRDRVWFIAHNDSNGCNRGNSKNEINSNKRWKYALNDIIQIADDKNNSDSDNIRPQRSISKEISGKQAKSWKFQRDNTGWGNGWPISSPVVCGVDDGIPDRMDRLKALGNAIVPQVAYEIFKAIEQMDNNESK